MKTIMIMLVLAISTVAMAQTFTVKLGDEFVFGDICLERMGPIQVGVAGAVDYFMESSNTDDIDIDFGDSYIGPIIKFHVLPKDSDVVLCAEYAPMFVTDQLHRSASEIIGATLSYKGFGISYQYFLDAYKTGPSPKSDLWMLSWTGGKF